MNARVVVCGLCLVFAQPSTAATALASDLIEVDAPELESREIRDLVSFVREAAREVEQRGEEAFDAFREKGGRWHQAERYLFVNDLKGNVLVDPNRSEFEGTNQLGLRDADGKPIVSLIIQEVSGDQTEGWVHYQWPKYALSQPYAKSTFVVRATAPSGKDYVVGSGLYNVKPQGAFIVDTVNEAAQLLKERGRQAFDELRDPAGRFLYGNTYVFVFDQRGTELVNAAFPSYEGRNLLDLKDPQGKTPTRSMIDALASSESAWVQYEWPMPTSARPHKKRVFVRKVETQGETLYVGSGIYLD